ncbi:hypothetical protein EZL74_07970 [Flavobacterium silvisoli]|uniref:Uncharacterized protein n=1 Tax=Flavobacterium silvisoli TaxID=2529433 RepID=A0A4Q9YXY9_9FLAO|nr:hypothetical protein [Flavobacterium silvisoli]TBX68722.1 hypothetical protein EZL74_07970 [Flavobacterium silvisoli]
MNTKLEQLTKKANWLLTGLKDHPKKEDWYTVTLNFSCYSSLYGTVNDLMKLCTVALLTEPPYISPMVGNPNIDLANILELAIQLMPKSEPEFLDGVKELLRETTEETEEQLPQFNFSTIRVLEEPTVKTL